MTGSRRPAEERLLVVRVGDERLSLAASAVAEVVRRPVITRVPQAPAALAGLANVRGRVVPVLALDEIVGAQAGARRGERLVLLDRDEPVALAVDEVSSLQEAADDAGAKGAPRRLSIDDLLQHLVAAGGRAVARGAARPRASESRAVTADDRLAFLQFELSGQAYAMALDGVREVIAAPKDLLRLPASHSAVIGVIDHRGGLLPVVAPHGLLGLDAQLGKAARVVVAQLPTGVAGLLADRVTGILRVEPARVVPAPAILNRGGGEAWIESVARTQAGLVALLSPERLFRAGAVELEAGQLPTEVKALNTSQSAGAIQVLVFRLGEETYALPLAAVDEVIRYPDQVTRVPRSPPFLAGVASHRGEALPIVDQRVRFGVAGSAPSQGRRVLIARQGDARVGFAVDAVDALVAIPAERLSVAPELVTDHGRLFDRVAQVEVDGRPVLLVNPQELLDQAERDMLAAIGATGPEPS